MVLLWDWARDSDKGGAIWLWAWERDGEAYADAWPSEVCVAVAYRVPRTRAGPDLCFGKQKKKEREKEKKEELKSGSTETKIRLDQFGSCLNPKG